MRTFVTAAAALAIAAPAWALFKVVGPDGKVTYTDRPPAAETRSRVTAFRPGHSLAVEASLPVALRQAVAQHPVTLYTGSDCVPCDSARQLLQQRGVPYTEKLVTSPDDLRALDLRGGGRTLPGLSIGQQQLRGLNAAEWIGYLDAAGYPKTSALPAGWKAPPATPLAEPRPDASASKTPAPTPTAPVPLTPAAPVPPPSSGTTLRF